MRGKHRNPSHNSSAMYALFAGVRRHDGDAAGTISIYWFEHGWFWVIPLADGATSIGAVTWPYYMKQRAGRSLDDFLADTIALSPALVERLQGASRISQVEATGNFSYTTDHTHGPHYILLGDAYAFIDPVFSSGVMLAMQGAFFGADAVDISLRQPERTKAAMTRFDKLVRHGPKAFSWFIYRMTSPTMRDLFMGPRNLLRMKEALLSLLAGDIYGKTPIWPSLLAFKALYYLSALRHLPRTLEAGRKRKRDILPVEDSEMAVRGGVAVPSCNCCLRWLSMHRFRPASILRESLAKSALVSTVLPAPRFRACASARPRLCRPTRGGRCGCQIMRSSPAGMGR
jgi:hypothetical protein